MSYVALYRKLRPTKFSRIVGQDQIVTTLKNQIINKRISHAYLFSGTRGTGKTTMAKIFAKVINCENHIDGEPCNVCNSCELINNEQSLNIIEIDAASNNGVDSIRDIRDEVKYPPTQGFYKVYIIDEVHMLSIGAFNALLKTLEEPPEHVVFILATTDPQKIPPTILSRCQRFDFKRITVQIMKDTIKNYMLDEKVQFTDEALDYISYLSDGAMRDALSILDQCIAFYFNEEINIEKVKIITGSVSTEVFFNLTEAFLTFDSNKCLKIIDEIIIDGRDILQFISELLVHFRDLLVAKSIDKDGTALAFSKEHINKLKDFGKEIPSEILINYINVFSILQNRLKYSKNPRIDFEIACIQVCNPVTEKDNSLLLARIEKLELIIEKGDFSKKKDNTTFEEKKIAPVYKTKAIKEDFEKAKQDYKNIIKKLDALPLDKDYLANANINYLDSDILYIILTHKINIDILVKNNVLDKLNIIFSENYGKLFNIEFITRSDFDNRSLNLYGKTEDSFDDMVNSLNEKINYNNIQNM